MFEPFVLPDATIESAPVFKLPSVSGKTNRGRARQVPFVAKPVSEPLCELDPTLLDQD